MPEIADALLEDRHGAVILLEVTPGAKKDAFPAGYNEWRKTISCRVTAQATGGKANHAVISLVSEKLAVPATAISIQSGAAKSQKRVLVTGINKQDLLSRLQEITGWQ